MGCCFFVVAVVVPGVVVVVVVLKNVIDAIGIVFTAAITTGTSCSITGNNTKSLLLLPSRGGSSDGGEIGKGRGADYHLHIAFSLFDPRIVVGRVFIGIVIGGGSSISLTF